MIYRRRYVAFALALLLGAACGGSAQGQCILANPSFELDGSSGQVFGGWNQFGSVGVVGEAYHGAQAALVRGPNNGGWDVSGFWQSQDCAPGEQWEATGWVRHPASAPLSGQNSALVNIEWRDAAGELIDYESFTVADAGSPLDAYLDYSVLSDPAPVGTASTLLLFGVLQSPSDPVPEVHYDQVTFYSTGPPTIDDRQWQDFPGGRSLVFAGRTWRVKGPGWYGPGYNYFCDENDCVWVDENDRLHLTLTNRGETWACTELTVEESLGYGDYILTTTGQLDLLDPQVVLGIFLWQYGTCWGEEYLWWNPYNEIDIEYSRWGSVWNSPAQFVAQPYYFPGNIERFDASFSPGEIASHAMRWLPDRVEYRVWRGGPTDESTANLIHAWTYTGPHIPRPEQPRLHLNLWKLGGTPAEDQEVVFTDFVFVPEGGLTAAPEEPVARIPGAPAGRLHAAAPNPFNPRTTIRYELTRDESIALEVYDLAGRKVRTLVRAHRTAGLHHATWDGRDDADRALGSGVYLVRLRGSDFVDARTVLLLE